MKNVSDPVRKDICRLLAKTASYESKPKVNNAEDSDHP
jgi:hypothetical protein